MVASSDAALYPLDRQSAELAALAVDYAISEQQIGTKLLEHVEKQARMLSIEHLFILTTQASDWFKERGFLMSSIEAYLPKINRLYIIFSEIR